MGEVDSQLKTMEARLLNTFQVRDEELELKFAKIEKILDELQKKEFSSQRSGKSPSRFSKSRTGSKFGGATKLKSSGASSNLQNSAGLQDDIQ